MAHSMHETLKLSVAMTVLNCDRDDYNCKPCQAGSSQVFACRLHIMHQNVARSACNILMSVTAYYM